jgi:hypothetical protein
MIPSRPIYKRLILILVVLASFAVTCAFFFPGLDDNDINTIIEDALLERYRNWHSAFLPFCLHLVLSHFPKLTGYDVLFSATHSQYWVALGIIAAKSSFKTWQKAIYILLGGFFPPAFLLMLATNKDTLMCSTLLLSYALLLVGDQTTKRNVRILSLTASLLLMFSAISVRHNGFIASMPLCIYFASIVTRNFGQQIGQRKRQFMQLGFGTVLTIALTVMSSLFDSTVLKATDEYPAQMVIVWDLVNTSVLSNDVCVPNIYKGRGATPIDISYLKGLACDYGNEYIFWWKRGVPLLEFVRDKRDYDELKTSWILMVIKHPGDYLKHRWIAFLSLIGVINDDKQIVPYFFLTHDRQIPLPPYYVSPLSKWIHAFCPGPPRLQFSHLFTIGWPYLVVLSGALLLGRLKFPKILEPAEYFLVSSALLHASAFFLLSTSDNQRHMTFPICVFSIVFSRWVVSCFQNLPFKKT